MSRPPQQDPFQLSAAANRRNIIDFVGVPVAAQPASYSYDDHYIQSMHPPAGGSLYHPPMLCAPGVASPYAPAYPSAYPALPGAPYMQSAYPTTPLPPGQQPSFMAAPYGQYPVAPAAPDGMHVSSQPSVTEESLRNKINSKIESIMEMQKADMLSNQIEKLTNKVQKLSNSIENKAAASSTRAAEKSYVGSRDDEVDARLRRLAAESSRKAMEARKRGTADW